MRSHIQKWGNSLALRIPKSVAAEAGLQKESAVDISLADGKVVVSPIIKPAYTLKKLLAGISTDNLHGEVDAGTARGNEIW